MAAFFGDKTVCSVRSGLVWRHGSWRDQGALVVVAREVGRAVHSVSVDQSKFPEVLGMGYVQGGRQIERE